jgi:Uma2 family endonuclease
MISANPRKTPYEELIDLPESLTGEVLNGQLYAHPRPGGRHILVASNIGAEFHGPYQRGKGGPGGWWILVEPEVHFVLDRDVTVPDVAGWQKSRMADIPEGHKFTVVPDWVCEILSPSTESIDREIKMPLYATYGVRFLWLVHPLKKTIETYKLEAAQWVSKRIFRSGDSVCCEPFEALAINLNELME